MAKVKNQVCPPTSKKKRMDAQGNDRRRLGARTGTATTIIAEGATENCYKTAWARFVKDIEAGGGKVKVQDVVFR